MTPKNASTVETGLDEPHVVEAPTSNRGWRSAARRRVLGNQNIGLLAFLALLVIVFSIASPVFLSYSNFTNMLLAIAVIGIMAAVGTLVLVSGGLDLSIGSVAALSGVVAAQVITDSVPLGILAGLAVGAAAGAFNGFIVTKIGINAIITTIATLSVFRGMAFVATEGRGVPVSDEAVIFLGSGRVLGLPVSVLLMLAVFAVTGFIANRTRVGRSLYAIGANPTASLLSGIRVDPLRFGTFVASGVSAATAGIVLIGLAGTAAPSAAQGYEFLVVTALLLGGASLAGGVGGVSGTLLGVLVIGILTNGMTLLGVHSFYQLIASGVLLLLALSFDRLRRGRPV